MDWTDTRIDELRTLVSEGAKMAAMLQHFGPDATRGAIMGQKNRLGLCKSVRIVKAERSFTRELARDARRIQAQREAANERRAQRKARLANEPKPPRYTPVCHELPDGRVSIHELRNGMCSFPFDAPPGSELSTVYCGEAVVDRSWCADHRRIVYQPARGA